MFLLFLLGTSFGFMLLSMLAAWLIRQAILYCEEQSEQLLQALDNNDE